MTLELVPLATMSGELGPPISLGKTPAGDRLIFEVLSGGIEGERISGKLKGRANADWLTIGPDGTGTLDVRLLVETHDGALVLIQYLGRLDASAGGAASPYIAPRFETGDDRYRWMNLIQAVGKGKLEGTTLTYEIYELK